MNILISIQLNWYHACKIGHCRVIDIVNALVYGLMIVNGIGQCLMQRDAEAYTARNDDQDCHDPTAVRIVGRTAFVAQIHWHTEIILLSD